MSDERLTPERPPPDSLPWDTRVRIAVAETQGATWEHYPDSTWPSLASGWRLFSGSGEHWCVFWLALDSAEHEVGDLPNPLTDPAAWGALVEKERISIDAPIDDGEPWVAGGEAGHCTGNSPGEVVCIAVLMDHAHPDLPALLESRP